LIDGAHNEGAIQALIQYLNETEIDFERRDALFGCMADRDWKKLILPMENLVGDIYLPSYFPERETPPTHLFEEMEQIPSLRGRVHLVDDLESFLKSRKDLVEGLLIFGSFYLAGRVLSEVKCWDLDS
jgi:folylpolyglutamate synthase/dihydropteroate synthase